MSEVYKTLSLVINSLRWSESSKIVQLFTPDRGVIKVIAKGALRPKSDFRGILETLNYIEVIVSFRETRGLQILTSASNINSFLKIKENLYKTAVALSYAELIQQFLRHHEPVKDFFFFTLKSLQFLNESKGEGLKLYLWQFILKLSQVLGFGWELDRCLTCHKPVGRGTHVLDYREGGIVCQACLPKAHHNGLKVDNSQVQLLQRLNSGKTEIYEKADSELAGNIDFTENLLQHLSHHTETFVELKSLKWYI
ncbi:MAG: DNA repair protein RecO [Calditrichia bacterium]